jgi:RAB6A-GEF complex partner protein 1
MHEFRFKYQHNHSLGPGEGPIKSIHLSFSLAIEVDSGAQCGAGLPDGLITCTSNPPSFLALSWDGEVKREGTLLLKSLPFYIDGDKDAVAQFTCNDDYSLFGLITISGRAYLLIRDSKGWNGKCIYDPSPEYPPATTLDFNPSFSLIAIGDILGVVHVYSVVKSNQQLPGVVPVHSLDQQLPTTVLSYSLAITKPGDNKPIKLSAVSSLSWSSDGYALGVSWVYGGLSVWSVYGCLLTSTVSEDTYVHSSDGIVTDTDEIFFTGTQDLFWAKGDYYLFVLPSQTEFTSISGWLISRFS